MGKLNFSVLVDKVESGSKIQTIRLWDQPSIKKMKVGDRVNLWWTKRGLKKDVYCHYCARQGLYLLPSQCDEHVEAIRLPRLLGVGTITEKFKIAMVNGDEKKNWIRVDGVWVHDEWIEGLAESDGFETVRSFFEFFKRYGVDKKPVEFAVIRWKLESNHTGQAQPDVRG